jgi:hypothetical protein
MSKYVRIAVVALFVALLLGAVLTSVASAWGPGYPGWGGYGYWPGGYWGGYYPWYGGYWGGGYYPWYNYQYYSYWYYPYWGYPHWGGWWY